MAEGAATVSVHGTCVGLGAICALLRGASGSGKSDLALRFLFLPPELLSGRPRLIADDRVILEKDGDRILASSPSSLTGRIEVRGVGIAQFAVPDEKLALKLLVDLESRDSIPRFPMHDECENVLGVPVRRLSLEPFEASAPIKLALALKNSPHKADSG